MNSKNSETSGCYRLLLKLTDKLNLKRSDKYVALSYLSIYYTWTNIKKSYKNNKFKVSAPTWNEKFDIHDGSYSVLDIQYYFEYIFKKHGEKIDNPSIRIYVNKIENIISFRIKMKLLRSTKSKITKNENSENVPHLEITEVTLSPL